MPFALSLFGFAMANLTQSASLEKKIAEAELIKSGCAGSIQGRNSYENEGHDTFTKEKGEYEPEPAPLSYAGYFGIFHYPHP